MSIQSDLFAVGVKPYWKVSDCGTWRYLFGMRWDERRGMALFFLLNPSLGEPSRLDATMKKCAGFARRWHLGGFEIVNPFAFRTPNPDVLAMVDYDRAVGPQNTLEIMAALQRRPARIIAGWGGFAAPMLDRRLRELAPAFRAERDRGGRALEALRVTAKGAPWHPLYVPYSAMPISHFEPLAWAT